MEFVYREKGLRRRSWKQVDTPTPSHPLLSCNSLINYSSLFFSHKLIVVFFVLIHLLLSFIIKGSYHKKYESMAPPVSLHFVTIFINCIIACIVIIVSMISEPFLCWLDHWFSRINTCIHSVALEITYFTLFYFFDKRFASILH